jgi:hypothetical protein
MLRDSVALLAVAALVICPGMASAQSQTEQEVRQTIIEGYDYANTNLQARPYGYSQHGALEFWSSGGLLQEISPTGRPEEFDSFSIRPKHIRVTVLIEGQVAMAHFYAEGSMKPKGSSAVSNYLVRVTQVYVKEAEVWKIRSAHWSPILGGSGTSQTGQIIP